MDGWMDGWTDGWMDGRIHGWMDGRMDGRIAVQLCSKKFKLLIVDSFSFQMNYFCCIF